MSKNITDWASAEIKHSDNELDLNTKHDRYNKFERTETRLFLAACPGYALTCFVKLQ